MYGHYSHAACNVNTFTPNHTREQADQNKQILREMYVDIQIKNLNKQFQNSMVLNDVNLQIKSGELIALLGSSGSGKTTLLRIIAGLEFADTGSILFDHQEIQTKSVKERNIGFVFQHYALFKHMTVFENVAFGLKVRPKKTRPHYKAIKDRVMNLLRLVRLEAFYDRYPHQLSGGQRQRVALVRALAIDPTVLLLDEPFGALDTKVRKQLRRWIRKLHDEISFTSIFVTHDQEEAMEVSDRIVIMNQGKIIQVGTPEEVWHYPANNFVYDFLGNFNEFDGWQDEESNIYFNVMNKPIYSKPVKLYARPHDICVTKQPDGQEYIVTRVINISITGSLIKIELERKEGKLLLAEIPQSLFEELRIKRGDILYVRPTFVKEFD